MVSVAAFLNSAAAWVMGYFCPPLVPLGFLSRWQKYLSYTLKHMLSKMSGAVLHFTLPRNRAPRDQWKKASHHCWVPSSNILKLKGFTNSFKSWQRPAPNVGSPFPRNDMQKLFALENNFLRGKKEPNTCFLLRAAVVFAAQSMCKKWSWLCWVVAWSSQNHVCISTAWKSSVSPLESLSAKPTADTLVAGSGAGGLLMCCIVSLKLILMQWDTQFPAHATPAP